MMVGALICIWFVMAFGSMILLKPYCEDDDYLKVGITVLCLFVAPIMLLVAACYEIMKD